MGLSYVQVLAGAPANLDSKLIQSAKQWSQAQYSTLTLRTTFAITSAPLLLYSAAVVDPTWPTAIKRLYTSY